jgi:tetratricopeptide (TPR) repeat protein/tRNA A-37 threonylcarbamoyl transferase component Bud32
MPQDMPRDTMATFRGPGVSMASLFPQLLRSAQPESASQWQDAATVMQHGEPVTGFPLGQEPQRIRLLGCIGRGGFGEVHEALQATLGRTVAVKRLRSDITGQMGRHDRANIEAAFESEAVTTAALEHPNIVPVYDLCRDESGRPMLVMKRVRGRTWQRILQEDVGEVVFADYLARHVGILAAVVQAVAFAHSRGIVHRDLKPAQVMVGEYGEVLLIDWGLAFVYDPVRAAGEADASIPPWLPTAITASNPSGTVAFMAPEQTRRTVEGIGPHTDVYLLGGMLYYVLTGEVPHPAKDANAAFYQAAEGIVRPISEVAPQRPIPRELADLAMRALARDPDARIRSAEEFLAALRDFISGAGKRRQSNAAVDEAEAMLARAGDDYGSLGEVLVRLANASGLWPENPRIPAIRERATRSLSEAALRQGDLVLARHHAQALSEAGARGELLARIAGRAETDTRIRRQRALFMRASLVLTMLLVLGAARLVWVRLENAERLLEERDRAAVAREEVEDLLNYMVNDLGRRLQKVGRLDILDGAVTRSLAYFGEEPNPGETTVQARRRAVALGSVAYVQYARGQYREALATYQRALALARGERERDGATTNERDLEAGLLLGVGNAHLALGDLDAARASFSEAVGLYRALAAEPDAGANRRRNLGDALNNLAFVLRREGDPAGAIATHREALEVRRALAAAGDSAEYLSQLSSTQSQLGTLLGEQGAHEEAAASLAAAVDSAERAVALEPQTPDLARRLADAHQNLGLYRSRRGDSAAAIESYARVIEIRHSLAQADPQNIAWRTAEGDAHVNISSVYRSLGRHEDAIRHAALARDLMVTLSREVPANDDVREDEAIARATLSRALHEAGQPREAVLEQRTAVELMRTVAANSGAKPAPRRLLGMMTRDLAAILEESEPEQADASYREAAGVFEALLAESPEVPSRMQDLGEALADHAAFLLARGRRDEARAQAGHGCSVLARAVDADPAVAARARLLAACHRTLADTTEGEAAAAELARAADVWRRHRQARGSAEAGVSLDLAGALEDYGNALAALGRAGDARAAWEEALRELEPLSAEPEVPRGAGELAARLLAALGRAAEADAWRARIAPAGS